MTENGKRNCHSKTEHDEENQPSSTLFPSALLLTVSCGGVDSDAKAASLTNRSIERTSQLKLDDAEKLYRSRGPLSGNMNHIPNRRSSVDFTGSTGTKEELFPKNRADRVIITLIHQEVHKNIYL